MDEKTTRRAPADGVTDSHIADTVPGAAYYIKEKKTEQEERKEREREGQTENKRRRVKETRR